MPNLALTNNLKKITKKKYKLGVVIVMNNCHIAIIEAHHFGVFGFAIGLYHLRPASSL